MLNFKIPTPEDEKAWGWIAFLPEKEKKEVLAMSQTERNSYYSRIEPRLTKWRRQVQSGKARINIK